MLAVNPRRAAPSNEYARGSGHLLEALTLCESILDRYKRLGLQLKDTELHAFNNVQRRIKAISGDAQSEIASSIQSPALKSTSEVIAQDLRDFTKLAQQCVALQRSISETAVVLNKELTTLFSCPARTHFFKESDNVLCDPVSEAVAPLDASTKLSFLWCTKMNLWDAWS